MFRDAGFAGSRAKRSSFMVVTVGWLNINVGILGALWGELHGACMDSAPALEDPCYKDMVSVHPPCTQF